MTNPPPNSNAPVFTAAQYLDYLRAKRHFPKIESPNNLIFSYQRELPKYVERKYRVQKVKIFGSELLLLKKFNRQIGLVSGFGAGAPTTATVTDLFCAFGTQQFFIIGLAGSLQPELTAGSLVLSTGAIRGDGVSRHYLPDAEIVNSSAEMLGGLSHSLESKNYPHSTGITWTTDAPFRERRDEVLEYQRRGVLAVDMEAAAMFAVAEANQRSALAAFAISDSLANGVWQMPQDLGPAWNGLFTLFDSVVEFLSSK